MKKEIFLGALVLGVSLNAFSRPQRREIGKQSNWQCQWEGGCDRSFYTGWMIEINHEEPGNLKK